MKAALKILAIALAGLVVLATLAVVAITTFINPNDYKPQIESLAVKQGYPIAIQGELGWQFFPKLGITIGHSKLLGNQPEATEVISVDEIRASVMVMPLLSKQVVIDQVLLDGIKANLAIDTDGNPNWAHLIPEDDTSQANAPQAPDAEENTAADTFALAANSIHLKNADIHYRDEQSDTDLRLQPLNVEIDRFNLDGLEFPVRIEWATEFNLGTLPQTLINTGAIEAAVTLAKDFSSAQIDKGALNMEIGNSDTKQHTLVQAAFTAQATDLQKTPLFKLDFELTPTDVKAIANNFTVQPLETQAPQAMTKIGLGFTAQGSADDIQIEPLAIQLDDTDIKGSMALRDQNQFKLLLTGGAINVDDYLPPADHAATSEQPAAPPTEASTTETNPADALAVLNDYQGTIDVNFERITASGIELYQPTVKANLAEGVFTIDPISAEIQGKTAKLTGFVNAQSQVAAKLRVPSINLRQLMTNLNLELPETADTSTLQALDLSLDVSGSVNDIAVKNINLGLDQTRITGSAQIKNSNTITINLAGTELDVDRYLPPVTDQETIASAEQQPETADEPIDLSALKTYHADASLTFDKLKANNLELANLNLNAKSQNGLAQLKTMSADFYQGKLNAQGQLDARNTTPTLRFTGAVSDVAIKPLMTALATSDTQQKFALAGLANGKVEFKSQGQSVANWVANAQADINATTQSLQLAPINVQKMVCQAMALVQGETIGTIDWPEVTQMQDLNAQITYANQVATINSLSAGVEQFKLLAEGKVDIGNESLDVSLPVSFSEPITQQEGCPETSAWIVGKALSFVRCKGSLLEPTKACGLDDRAIRTAVKDYAKAQLQEKLDAKTERAQQQLNEKKDQLKDKINEELGEGTTDLLNSIFNRKKSNDD